MLPRRIIQLMLLAISCFTFVLGQAQPAAAASTTLLGVYYGNEGWQMQQVRELEQWQGKKNAVVNMFTNWCSTTTDLDNLFNQQLLNIWNNRNVPMITWEPYLCSATATPNDVEVQAANGAYDTYVALWVDRLKVFLSGPDGVYGSADDRRAYLRLGHEMNGNWYPWSAAVGNNSPADYVRMWQRVKGIFTAKGMESTRLQWVWSVNNTDSVSFTAEAYYPGNAYVDWVAIDGYNWGTSQPWSSWQAPAAVYGNMLGRLRAISTKPVAITELASSTALGGGMSVAAKAQWITDVYAYVQANGVRMVAWFNADKETDWAMFGGSNGSGVYKAGSTTYKIYAAYKSAVGSKSVVGAYLSNARLLTDAQFAGQ